MVAMDGSKGKIEVLKHPFDLEHPFFGRVGRVTREILLFYRQTLFKLSPSYFQNISYVDLILSQSVARYSEKFFVDLCEQGGACWEWLSIWRACYMDLKHHKHR